MIPRSEIIKIYKGSLAEELSLKIGDKILSVNGQKLMDIIDLSFALADEDIDMLVEHKDGTQEMIEFSKDCDEKLGVEFASAVFDNIRRCANKCYFCFVDQIAPNMRDTLSINDDDYRLSFLYGNFVSMTNMGKKDFERIHRLHLSPLYLSIHSTNPQLRMQMMKSKKAGELASQLDLLAQMDIQYHTQIVLCPHLNDGEELERTISDLSQRIPHALSIAIVPVGLTKYRDNCVPLTSFASQEMAQVIEQVERWQQIFREKTGKTFIYLSDEFYLGADCPLPLGAYYDGFPQLDNGIGLSRNFIDEWEKLSALNDTSTYGYEKPTHITVLCGTAAKKVLQPLLENSRITNLKVHLLPVENKLFGPKITVSGLLSGKDILAALKSQPYTYDGVIVPASSLRTGEDIFIDNMTLVQLQEATHKEIKVAADAKAVYKLLTQWYKIKDVRTNALYTWQSNAAYTK